MNARIGDECVKGEKGQGMRDIGRNKGLTNGAVHSNGMTSGQGGMTNGMGGRTNGMTNGLGGKTNGLTNGMGGRTNGMTNGLEGGPIGRSRRLDDRAVSPSRISLVLIIAFIVMVPAFFFLLDYDEPAGGEGGISVDGSFNDWTDALIFTDSETYPTTSLDIVKYSAEKNDAGNMFLYAKAAGNWFSSSEVDSLFVFIDADDKPSTGYSVRGIGAEYVIEIHGWEGEIKGRQIGTFEGADQQNWSAWTWSGGVAAAKLATEMEIRTPRLTQLTPESTMRFMTKRGGEIADICDAAITPGRSALTVRQMPKSGIITGSNIMELLLTSHDAAMEVTAINFAPNTGSAAAQGLPVTIAAGQTVKLQVELELSGISSGTLVEVGVSNVVNSAAARVTVLGEGVTAYAHNSPGQILIDGAFGDWNLTNAHQDALNDAANPDINIAQYMAVNSTTKAFFYLKVHDDGTLMGGGMVPQTRAKPGPAPVDPVQPTPPAPLKRVSRVSGEDVARIYIDTKSGGRNIGGIAADYLIEIKGRNGKINSQKLYSMQATGMSFIANIDAANRGMEMEVGLLLSQIDYAGNLGYFMESTDWAGNEDRTDSANTSMIGGTRGSVPTGPLADGDPVINTDTGLAYTTIQAAIDATETLGGHTIRVWAGTYNENVVVNKALTITGNGSAVTTINAGGSGIAVNISAANTVISGFKITGSGSTMSGMYYDCGVFVNMRSGCRVTDCNMTGNWVGVYVLASNSFRLDASEVFSNSGTAVLIGNTQYAVIEDNLLAQNHEGIRFSSMGSNTVRSNDIRSHTGVGIYIYNSNSNTIYHNNFVSNGGGHATTSTGANTWDSGYQTGGNYFDDHMSPDIYKGPSQDVSGSDGIVDNARAINGDSGTDRYPVTAYDGWLNLDTDGPVINLDSGETFWTIQAAIDDSDTVADHTVYVTAGTYSETLTVSKAIELRGAGLGNTTIDGGSIGTVVSVTANGASVSNFTIKNSGNSNWDAGIKLTGIQNSVVENNSFTSCWVCIFVQGGSFNTVARNTYRVFLGYGIYLATSNNNTVANNTDTSTPGDTRVYGSISLSSADGNIISGNAVKRHLNGILLYSGSDNNTVKSNTAQGNWYGYNITESRDNVLSNNLVTSSNFGIRFDDADYNTIRDNNASSNGYGIYLLSCTGNEIYHNIFISNTNQAYDDGTNSWDDGYPSGGNYWSDYSGSDDYSGVNQDVAGADKIGDTPYSNIGGGAGAQDDYPLYEIPEFQNVLLMILSVLGTLFLAKRGKIKVEEETVDELDFEKPDAEEVVSTPEDDEDASDKMDFEEEDTEEEDIPETEDEDSKPPKIKNTLLIIGLVLGVIGLGGIAGLRSGIIQTILGYSASPGIGSQEMMALAGSMVPLAIGLAFIGLWGVRNDPIYHQIEREKELGKSEYIEEDAEKEYFEGLDDLKSEITREDVPEEFNKPIIEDEAPRPEKKNEEPLKEPEKHLGGKEKPKPGQKIEVALSAKPKIRPELERELEELDNFDLELAKAEEDKRVQRCEKMLGAAVILPDDKQRLKALIPTGISIQNFTAEVKKAVERRKKKEEEKDVTSDEKASILEDELIAELGELGDELNDDKSALEENLLKELDDLGDL